MYIRISAENKVQVEGSLGQGVSQSHEKDPLIRSAVALLRSRKRQEANEPPSIAIDTHPALPGELRIDPYRRQIRVRLSQQPGEDLQVLATLKDPQIIPGGIVVFPLEDVRSVVPKIKKQK